MNDQERLAAHEAAHASAAVALGLPVLTVSTVPDDTTLGRVQVIYRNTEEDRRRRMLVILAASVETEPADRIPSWPLEGDSSDERNLRSLATQLNLTEDDYAAVVTEAIDLTLRADYRQMHVAVTGMLDYTPHIDPALLIELKAVAARRK